VGGDVKLPGSLSQYADAAREVLDHAVWAYLDAAAGDGRARRANSAAWDRVSLWPRVLRPLAGSTQEVELLGKVWPHPILVAPLALHRLVHPDGEMATAVAASAQGAGFVLSTRASVPLETVAAAVAGDAGRGPLWFQLYLQPNRSDTLDLVRRAEAAGYEALVLTVDAALRAPHPMPPLPASVSMVHVKAALPQDAPELQALAPTWDDVAWLLGRTRLPVLLKGILHPADAAQAVRAGVQGLVVSNHGGRTFDAGIATAQALPKVVDATRGAIPVLVDGGIERGSDVLKALALGARAVLVGRPVLHGLAVAGAHGVAHVLRLLRDGLTIAMAQCGVRRCSEISRDWLGFDQIGIANEKDSHL
jgi:4-hydroxymandelate oxidase